jgi:hypothetical protein
MIAIPASVGILAGLDDEGEVCVALTVDGATVTLTQAEAKAVGVRLLLESGAKQWALAHHHDLGQMMATLHEKSHRQGLDPGEEAKLHVLLLERMRLEAMLRDAGEGDAID